MMKNSNKNFVITLLIIGAAVLLFSGCPMRLSEDKGMLTFPDFAEQVIIFGDVAGSIEYGEVLAGESLVENLKIQNSGESDLVITEMYFDNSIFAFLEGYNPDLPVIIPAGRTIDNIYLEFSPVTAGDQTGFFILKSEGIIQKISLSGTGMWALTLNAVGNGKILSPIEVLSGETGQITTSTGIVELTVEPDFMTEFDAWTVDSSSGEAPVFDDITAQETIITVKSHTEISTSFYSPFVLVPDDRPNIQDAINDCVSAGLPDAVAVSAGTHNVGYDITLADGVPIYGGYDAGWADRKYLTPADRNNATYATIINFTTAGECINSGTDVGSTVLLEGFTIQRAVSSSTPLISCTSSSTPIIKYNTITANGSGPAVKCDGASPVVRYNVITGGNNTGGDHASSTAVQCINSADPRIEANTITGGTATGNYSKAYTVRVEEGSSPVIYNNTITGGTADGTSGDSFGIRNDFDYCEPVIIGNVITGGTVTDSSGGKTYGIFCINNGKIDIYYNDIDGGSGGTASHSVFASQGMNLYMEYNNIFTTAVSDADRYGIYLGINGRLRKLLNSGLYDCPILLYKYLGDEEFDKIDDVNDECHTDTNVAEHITYTLPEDIEAFITELENN